MRRLVMALRGLAIAMAIAGAVDPACVTARWAKPRVALVDAGSPDLTRDLDRMLTRDFAVHAGPMAGAAATLVAGTALPSSPPAISGVLVAVAPVRPARRVESLIVTAPVDARPGSVAAIDVAFRAMGLAGRTLRVDLRDVTTPAAPVLVDRADHAVTSDGDVRLRVTAPVGGDHALRLDLVVTDPGDLAVHARASMVIDVVARPWRVVVLDARPSWPTTFVRRALEADARFRVAARVTTSRGRAALTGETSDLSSADVVVIGAPEALDPSTTRMLERLARERGGAIVLMADALDAGVVPSLAGGGRVRELHGVERRWAVTSRGTLVGTTFAIPVALAPGATALAALDDGAPVVWQLPLGPGRVIMNGALDAWRYREREHQGFAAFWRAVIADAAAAVPPPVSVWPTARLATPGAPVDVRVVVRDAQLSDPLRPSPTVAARARVRAEGDAGGSQPIPLWPSPERGVFAGVLNSAGAPLGPGRYVVEAFAPDHAGVSGPAEPPAAAVAVVIADDAPTPDDTLAPWAASRGGVAVTGVEAARAAVAARVTTSPAMPSRVMRDVWWLPVFLVVVGVEWWIRRYYGLTP